MKGEGIDIDHKTHPDDAILMMSILQYPRLASPKLDGIRAVVKNGKVLSSRLKPIPNLHVQKKFCYMDGFDGELLINQPTMKMLYRNTDSAVMTRAGEPDILFWVFDYIYNPAAGYADRYSHLRQYSKERPFLANQGVKFLRHEVIESAKELFEYEQFMLSLGYEGVMTRSMGGIYKFGRSTLREGHIVKIKRFSQEEAEVVGFVEKMKNNNEQKRDERGYAKRSSHKAGKVPANTLGALVVQSPKYEGTFEIGSGLTAAEAQKIWNSRRKYLGRMVTFKFFEVGDYNVPRHPVFVGWRSRIDI